MSEAGIRLGPLHVAWSRPLQGLRLVFGRGLQSRAVRPLASGLTRSLTAQRSNNWQLPALPHVRSKIPIHARHPQCQADETLTKNTRLWTETSLTVRGVPSCQTPDSGCWEV